MSFLHKHPYPPFIFPDTERLIVGTLPPPRFSMGDLKDGDVHFCYGSRDGQLWPILDRIFHLGLVYEDTAKAIEQRRSFLIQNKIGICDIVESAVRTRIDASDLGMEQIRLREMFKILREYSSVHTLLFTGGNSKNGPEYHFRKILKKEGLPLVAVSDEVPRIHEFELDRKIRTVSLTAPSGAANRAVGSMADYKAMKLRNPKMNTVDYRVKQYRPFFL